MKNWSFNNIFFQLHVTDVETKLADLVSEVCRCQSGKYEHVPERVFEAPDIYQAPKGDFMQSTMSEHKQCTPCSYIFGSLTGDYPESVCAVIQGRKWVTRVNTVYLWVESHLFDPQLTIPWRYWNIEATNNNKNDHGSKFIHEHTVT